MAVDVGVPIGSIVLASKSSLEHRWLARTPCAIMDNTHAVFALIVGLVLRQSLAESVAIFFFARACCSLNYLGSGFSAFDHDFRHILIIGEGEG